MKRINEASGWIFFLFILVFLYSLMHYYIFLKAHAAFRFSDRTGSLLVFLMAFLIFAVLLGYLVERIISRSMARLMFNIGYIWFGISFYFFLVHLLIDAYRLPVFAGGFLSNRDFSNTIPSSKTAFYVSLMLSAVLNIYGYFEAKNIRTERVVIKTPKLPKGSNSLRIVQISDVHLGVTVGAKRLKRIIEEVKKAKPDILVSTGDLVDSARCNIERLIQPLREIQATYGKFAVTGNHEFYWGISQAKESPWPGSLTLPALTIMLPSTLDRPQKYLKRTCFRSCLLKFIPCCLNTCRPLINKRLVILTCNFPGILTRGSFFLLTCSRLIFMSSTPACSIFQIIPACMSVAVLASGVRLSAFLRHPR